MGFPNDISLEFSQYPMEFMVDGVCDECDFFKDVGDSAKPYEHCRYAGEGIGMCGATIQYKEVK